MESFLQTLQRAASKSPKLPARNGFLWRHYRGRLLRVVKSDEEVKEIMIRFHDNNNHLMFYWVGVTEVVKSWINKCEVCQNRVLPETKKPSVQFCFVYGCESSSSIYPELSFHRFPEDKEIRQRWLSVAQRDENSLRSNSFLCSKHFEPSCFTLSDEVQLTLSPDAVPVPSEEDFLFSNSLEDLFSKTSSPPPSPMELQEHQYCLQDPEPTENHKEMEQKRRFLNESSFKVFNHIARYLSHRILPMQNKKGISSLKRMTNRFALKGTGTKVHSFLSYVNSILRQFHDDQGHSALVFCQREITKRFFWARMTRDVARWISCCQTCMDRTKRRWLRCSVRSCTNSCGPVSSGRHTSSSSVDEGGRSSQLVSSPRIVRLLVHFSEECFDRSGEKVTVRTDAVPTLMVHGNQETPLTGPTQPAVDEYDAVELYLIKRTYPPGLSYVEKNTFRRFCKRYCIKGDSLHTERGNRLCLVLRSRKKVEEALLDFHDELNHLNVNKCLRLLNERIPILVHLKTPINFPSSTPITLQPTTSNALNVARPFQNKTLSSSSVNSEQTGPQEQKEIVISHVSARTLHFVKVQDIINPLPESNLPPELTAKHKPPQSKNKKIKPPSQGRGIKTQTKSLESAQQPKRRRKKDLEADKTTSSCGLEPLLAPSSKPWPVFTISDSSSTQSAKPPTNVDRYVPILTKNRNITLQARIVLQQCSEAKLKSNKLVPPLSGRRESHVGNDSFISSCSVISSKARSLMTTTFFRKDSGHSVSVLDVPGSVLFINQESLLGEGLPKRRMENRRGGQLFSTLISKCREKMAASEKCRKAGVKVEHGEYGKKQEVSLKSAEPMTLLMEF
ncbi:hypothetical protein F7725_008685 [Dissostichus mawsoni]|uniref:D-aminoacyl-tRNA deacylase n=1 Tax=Dissostichus mawsoni TaxID=36200 RepID=A0A7J5Y7U6_DISMA|nr:hypothetical protein F7725_008685 [Dissostichus mawsoni]